LIIYSIRTIQLFDMRITKTDRDIKLLSTAKRLLDKYKDPHLDALATFFNSRQAEHAEETERIVEDFLKRTGTEHGIDPQNPMHNGRFNSTLGDLKITRAIARWSLRRGDAPDSLLSAWAPLNPTSPSTAERNAKWYRDRTVGEYLIQSNRFGDAERLLIDHVAEFAACDMEGTDEHLAGADSLADVYMSQSQWPRAESALSPALIKADEIHRDRTSWHVLHSNILFQVILINDAKYSEAEAHASSLVSLLREANMPNITATPLYTALCILARCAHEQSLFDEAGEKWRECLTLGRSMGWPEFPDLSIPNCALEAIEYESGRKGACDSKGFEEWKQRLYAAGSGNREFVGWVAESWRPRLEERMRGACEGL
jgi:hypothetical protein